MSKQVYTEYKGLNLPKIAEEILAFWEKEGIFEKSITTREGSPQFTFYEGPPSANGLPGIHHVMARSIKDIFCRYQTLKGFQVNRKAGWDTHGLPVELGVEKALGITKEDIGKTISVEEYNKACRADVMKYTDLWARLTKEMGYWVNMEDPYITYETNYMETVWYLLKMFFEKGYLYKGYTIQPYSPAAGTGLSTHELNQPGTYKPVKDTTIVAQFKVAEVDKLPFKSDLEAFFMAWTTTPWTLPSNTALAVGEKIDYVAIETFNPYTFKPVVVVMAKALMGKYFPEKNAELKFEDFKEGDKNIPFRLVGEFKGKDLVGISYEQLLPYAQPAEGDAFRVVAGDFVSTEDGTGIVHIAPSFGADDFRTAKQNGIGTLTLVDLRGKFTAEMGEFAGEYVKEQYLTDEEKEAERVKQGRDKYLNVDERIAIKLKTENRAFKVEKYEHNYPHCWRTDKPVLYYPLDSWFIKTTAAKPRLIELNKTINWMPESTGSGRFGNWLENLQDWNLSRSRYWGIPLPLWISEDKTETICIGSVEELNKEIEKSIAAGVMSANPLNRPDGSVDLHKPFVDEVILISASGQKMFRESDLIDVWFDSGAMPYAQLHWPFENQDKFKTMFPADFIAEGVDQTRGWFFTLHTIAVMLFDSVAYKNVVSNGLVLDKNGNKMSKRLGNAVDPFETLGKYGPDATRWYMITNAQPWDNLKFDVEGIGEVQRKFFGTLYNTYSFFALYANIDKFIIDENNVIPVAERSELDRWILSKLHSLVKLVTEQLDAYDPTPAARAIDEFVGEHLSNWYVRLSRRRFWKGDMNPDKQAAYETLYECLNTVAQLMSPVAPFFADWLYQNLTTSDDKPESVHLTLLAKANENLIDKALEERMELAQKITSLTLALRKKVNIRVRQPLNKILVPVLNDDFQKKVEEVKGLILSEVNVKELEFLTDTNFLVKKIKPNFKSIGAKEFKNLMKQIAAAIGKFTTEDISEIETAGYKDLTIEGQPVKLELNDVEIMTDDIPGWVVNSWNGVTVALDITITGQLKEEGIARELVNRIQNIRKDLDYEVTDRIEVLIQHHDLIAPAVLNNFDYICAETLAGHLELKPLLNAGEAVNVEVDENVETLILITKLN
jgi:isoleucyl-tRNA synthetase